MPLQLVANNARRGAESKISTTSDESDDKSFVSAEGNTSPQRPLSGQSGKTPHTSSSTSQSHPSDISSNPSSTELKAQPTPVARKHITSSPISRPSPHSTGSQGTSYLKHQPTPTNVEPRSPPNRRAPASRSANGASTRSGPPPALITQRSYNDSPWRRHSQVEPTNTGSFESSNEGSIDFVLGQSTQNATGDMNGSGVKRDRRSRRSLDAMANSRRSTENTENDQDTTIRANGRHAQSTSLDLKNSRQQEDLFLNLARSDPLEDQESESMTSTNKRQVSCNFLTRQRW